jgi:hypothetical protein
MKSIKLIVFSIFLSYSAMSQFGGESSKQLYKSTNLKDSLAVHKIVAILPFKATIAYKRMPKGFDLEGNKAEEKKLGVSMQGGMFTYLINKRDKYTVAFQDVERTNILLKQAGVYDKLDEMLPDSIAKILQVDAVIICSYAYEKTGSEGGAIAKAILIGGAGKTGSGSLTMQIYNKSNGELLWRFYKEMNETITSNGNEVMERMMRKVSRNFPYEK